MSRKSKAKDLPTITVTEGEVRIKAPERDYNLITAARSSTIVYTVTFEIDASIMAALTESDYVGIVLDQAEATARSLYRRTRIVP